MTHSNQRATVLLTGAGGPAISGMIKILRSRGYRIIAVDMSAMSAGFYLADKSFIVPPGLSPDFLPRLEQICLSEGVSAVISVVDEELSKVLSLEQYGIKVIQPQLPFVELCLDKLRCMSTLTDSGIPAPATWSLPSLPSNVPYPLFVKPRTGRGSRGCQRINSRFELDLFLSKSSYSLSDLIAQQYIEGTEYTVSTVVWRDGSVQAVVPKEILSKIGVTKMAVTRKNERIDSLCRSIQDKLQANGPFNVQLILDKSGNPWPFEINPRFSTSITLTSASGVDELGGLLSQALHGTDSYHFTDWKEGIVLIRQTIDEFLGEPDFLSLKPIS